MSEEQPFPRHGHRVWQKNSPIEQFFAPKALAGAHQPDKSPGTSSLKYNLYRTPKWADFLLKEALCFKRLFCVSSFHACVSISASISETRPEEVSIGGTVEYLCHAQFFVFFYRTVLDISLVLEHIKTLKCYLSDPPIIVILNMI